jgi:very-short-patch-repair endonuclease
VEGNVRRVHLRSGDVVLRHGLPVTSPLRTCFDLACRLPLVEAVVPVHQALRARLVDQKDLAAYMAWQKKIPGLVQARRVLELAEPKAESPMESRLRLLVVRGGLPRPEAQVPVHDARGAFLGRLDLCYRQAKLGIEYDGENHRDRLTADNQRQNRLLEAGVHLLRFTGPDLATRPDAVVAEVGAALRRHEKPEPSLSPRYTREF